MLLAAGLFVFYQLFPTLLPILELIVLGMLLALVFRTIVNRLERFGAPSWLAVVALVAAVGAFGAFVGLVLAPNVMQEVQTLFANAPSYLESLRVMIQGVPYIPDPSRIIDRLQSYVSQLYGQIPSFFSNLAWVLGGIVAAVFLAIYMAASPGPLVSGFLQLVPRDRRGGAEEFLKVCVARIQAGKSISTIEHPPRSL